MTVTTEAEARAAIRRLRDLLWTPAPFRAWLERQRRPGTPVGRACHRQLCPIALFLHDRGYRNISVYSDQLGVWDPSAEGRIVEQVPDWAARFIDEVDAVHGTITLTVQRDTALAVLNGIALFDLMLGG